MKAYKPKNTNSSLLIRYAIMSLSVQAICYSVITDHLYNHISFDRASVLLILFNVLAIGCRPLISFFSDKIGSKHTGVRLSVFLVIAGYFWPVRFGINTKVVLLALGSAVFHSFAASSILSRSSGKSRDIGLFLAGDAMGLALSSFSGFFGHFFAPMLMIFAIPDDKYETSDTVPQEDGKRIPTYLSFIALPLMIAVYAFVSYAFSAIDFTWNTWFKTEFAIFAAMAVGRAAGGFVSDLIGRIMTVTASVCGGILLLYFCSDNKNIALIGLALLSASLPPIVTSAQRYLFKHPGFVFALLSAGSYIGQTLCLLIGFKTASMLFICSATVLTVASAESYFVLRNVIIKEDEDEAA